MFSGNHCKTRLLLYLYMYLLDNEIDSYRKKSQVRKFPFEIVFGSKNTLKLLPYFVKYFNYNKLIVKKLKKF